MRNRFQTPISLSALMILLGVLLFGAFTAPAPVVAQGDQEDYCLMSIEVHHVKVLADKGDSLFGLRRGDMELQLQLTVTNGTSTWDSQWPRSNDYHKVKQGQEIETPEFYVLVDMAEFTEDRLFIHVIGVDKDPIEVFGVNVEDRIESAGGSLLSGVMQLLAPQDLDEFIEALATQGIEDTLTSVTRADIVGQGGWMIDEENGWGTSEILHFITPDEGLDIEYQIYLVGPRCDTAKRSV